MASNAAGKAADGQTAAAGTATAEQARQFDLMRKDQAPWLNVGSQAIYRLGDLLGLNARPSTARSASDWRSMLAPKFTNSAGPAPTFNEWANSQGWNFNDQDPQAAYQSFLQNRGPSVDETALNAEIARRMQREASRPTAKPEGFGSLLDTFGRDDFRADPGYQFRLGEGEKAIERAAKARGMYMGPSTVKELLRYGQGFASNEYSNAYNRDTADKTRTFNFLSGTSGGGQTAANQVGQAGMNMATNVGNLVTGAANARGAAGIAGANAWGGAASNIGNWYRQQQMMNQMFPQGGGGSGSWYAANDPNNYMMGSN